MVSQFAWQTLLRNHPRNCNICTGFYLSNDFKKHSQGLVNIGNRQHLSSNVRLCRNLKFTLPMVTFVMRDKQNLLKNHTTPKNSICTMCKRNFTLFKTKTVPGMSKLWSHSIYDSWIQLLTLGRIRVPYFEQWIIT